MDDELERRKKRLAVEEQAIKELRAHMQTEDEDKEKSRRWHLGKEVPLVLVGTVILQTIGVVWGAATLSARVENGEKAAVVASSVQAAIDRRQDEEARRSEDRVVMQLEKVNIKLDRIMEKGVFK